MPGSSELVLSGSIGQNMAAWQEDLGVDDPAQFAAEALTDCLRDVGVIVRGTPQSQYCQPSQVAGSSNSCGSFEGTVLATHESAPLWQDVQVVNKISQNLHAEMLMREAGLAASGSGTAEAGVSAREQFLRSIGIAPDGSGFFLEDGSGLARQDLTTPDSTVALLKYMWGSRDREVWLQSLPIGGVGGSLQHRFHNMVGADRIHAKTGSISHVNTLSGYIETEKHEWLAFSVMVNGTVAPDSQVHDFLDSFCGLFLR